MEYTKKIVYQSNYWYNDGLRKAKIRDMSGAIMSLRKSLQFNRENIAARNLLGLVYYGIGEVPEALVEWIISKNLKSRDNIADYYIKNVQSSADRSCDQEIQSVSYILQTKRGGSGGDSVKTGDRGTSDIFKGVSAFNLDLSAYGAVFSGETDDQDGEKT